VKKSFPVIFTFILVISIIIVLMQQDKSYGSAANALEKVFSETGASAVSSEVYVRGSSKGRALDENDARSLLEDILEGIGAGYSKDIQVFKAIDNDYVSGAEINYIIDENKTIQLSISNEKNTDEKSTELNISLLDTSGDLSVRANADAVAGSLERRGIDYETNISLTGSIDGKMGKEEIEALYMRALGSIGADGVEGIDDNGLVSVSAFSPSIGRAVRVNGKRVNINMAARYNSYEDKTYIWLAVPVITTEY
jgi:hypothetical protein